MANAAAGFRAHTGWAAMVVVTGSAAHPQIFDRQRVELLAPGTDGAVYHRARELGMPKATSLVARVEKEAVEYAARALGAIEPVNAVGLVIGTASLPTSLEAILASHTLVHAAEGALYREALAAAAEARGLPVTAVPDKEVEAQARAAFGSEIVERVAALGKQIGPPWTQDQKRATLAALLALA